MPGQEIARPNPPPDPSLLPDSILQYGVQLKNPNVLSNDELEAMQSFRRAADYIAAGMWYLNTYSSYGRHLDLNAAMIFLKSNILLEKELTFDDIKPRLLGHWGTCPGLILVYAHLNRIVRKTGLNCLYVVGPGLYSSVGNWAVI